MVAWRWSDLCGRSSLTLTDFVSYACTPSRGRSSAMWFSETFLSFFFFLSSNSEYSSSWNKTYHFFPGLSDHPRGSKSAGWIVSQWPFSCLKIFETEYEIRVFACHLLMVSFFVVDISNSYCNSALFHVYSFVFFKYSAFLSGCKMSSAIAITGKRLHFRCTRILWMRPASWMCST